MLFRSLWAAVASFVLAGIMALLSILGFVHLRRTPPDETVVGFHSERELVNA